MTCASSMCIRLGWWTAWFCGCLLGGQSPGEGTGMTSRGFRTWSRCASLQARRASLFGAAATM